MLNKLLLTALSLSFVAVASASELDGDRFNTEGPALEGTVIFRVDTRTNETSMVQMNTALKSKEDAQKVMFNSDFKTLSTEKVRSELDNEVGSSSWYWYWGGYNYSYNYYYTPYYYNYGYYYRPYYYYNYGYYNYYCYGRYYGW